jgi:hypothetical protein
MTSGRNGLLAEIRKKVLEIRPESVGEILS